MSNAAIEKQSKFLQSVVSRRQTFQTLLPKGLEFDWYAGEVKVALARTPKLLECDQVSVFDALTTCAQLGLSPSGRLGSAYLIPFNGKCTLVIGYKGFVDLAYRSGEGKIERWHQTLKNRILLENYFFEGELEAAIAAFIDHYNNRRYHESLGNLTPKDVYFGRGETILAERRRIKRQTIQNRRLNHQKKAA